MLIYAQPYQRNTGRLNVRLSRNENGDYLLTAENMHDAPEILYRLCAVLYHHGWDILHADICTLSNLQIQDRFVIRPGASVGKIDDLKIEHMMDDFERLLFERISVLDYLQSRGDAPQRNASGGGLVEFDLDDSLPRITVHGRDRRGLLLALAQILSMMEIDILEALIDTAADGQVRNTFVVNPSDKRFRGLHFRDKLSDALRQLL
ncbi:MAG: hypothetical protein K1X75_03045 [Leptospirales bacterium]|nr:hypothetical protein [Leptospirales bacterium]